MNLFLTGASGFVARSVRKYLDSSYLFSEYNRYCHTNIKNESVVLHFAGKTHDLKGVSSPTDYYKVNLDFTKIIFDQFLKSQARVFIILSSVKAVADAIDEPLTEGVEPHPVTHYGKSKLLAEKYILSKKISDDKRVYILRACMIHGPGNKGNLNLLHKIVSKGLPWPLGMFENSRSFLSIENLCFVIRELIQREDIPSGIYNVADDVPLSTNDLIRLIAKINGTKSKILNINKSLIVMLSQLGDYFRLPLNSERLQKLTATYVVSNAKIKAAIGKPLPVSSEDGLLRTLQSFNSNGVAP